MNKQDQIEIIHDQAIRIAEANLMIASLQKENAMMKIKLAPILLQEQEEQEENAKDLAKYMGYNKPRFTDDELTNATVARILSERVG